MTREGGRRRTEDGGRKTEEPEEDLLRVVVRMDAKGRIITSHGEDLDAAISLLEQAARDLFKKQILREVERPRVAVATVLPDQLRRTN